MEICEMVLLDDESSSTVPSQVVYIFFALPILKA